MDYAFSASENAFYAKALIDDYIDTGSCPDDPRDVESRIYLEYCGEAPEGKYIIVDSDGMPAWADIPVDYKAKAETHRQYLLAIANTVTADWRLELQLGIISDDDKAQLSNWMSYIRAHRGLNLSCITDENLFNQIELPASPEES